MLTAKTLQAVGEGPPPQVRTTNHNEAGRLAPVVGVDHPDFAVFLHFALGSEAHAESERPRKDTLQSLIRTEEKLVRCPAVSYGYNMQSSNPICKRLSNSLDP